MGEAKFEKAFVGLENRTVVRAVREGLIHITPIVIIGAFALILQTFPVKAYQDFIKAFLDGFLLRMFEAIYSATFGILSVYMAYSISRAYMKLKGDARIVKGGGIVSSVLAFFILAGGYLPTFGTDSMGAKSMFLAIIAGLGASALYLRFTELFRKHSRPLFLIGADRDFNKMLSTIYPITCTTAVFGLLNTLICRIFEVDSFRTLLINFTNWCFSFGENGFVKGFFFVLISSVLWFFGIHGSDTLEGVMQTYFAPGVIDNRGAMAAGLAPHTILTKEFFDCFVLMGGCGVTICLLISILLFSKSKVRRGIGLAATLPMIFNINELMVFGLPIIFNPIMVFPFLVTPIVCYTVSYLAIMSGIVPMVTTSVAWTTPIILGGYQITGSVAGALLQVVNVVIGVIIYTPFVRLMDRRSMENANRNYDTFMDYFKANELSMANIRLTEMGNVNGDFAKDLCNDIKYGLKKQVVLAYQPQYNYEGECIGVEALLRWKHPVLGLLYPPLVIKLAEEGGFLQELEERILETALRDRPKVSARFGDDVKLSVNVTGTTVVTERYLEFCKELNARQPFKGLNLCIEVTEQAALFFTDETKKALRELRNMGILLAIDDFSMGQTSIHYLRENMFDIIKLDGSLINGIFTYENSRDIIISITRLAKSLNLMVLAEYVDSEEKRKALHEMGCDNYQGYLFSPAVFLQK
ncbi:MAG: PTS sugar transporter subunit IIC/EAL domain-containing protein [Lachnospiraceae bacterium]|nr:PTS sugar transporter subunit IIC/EAL domain-containing protein [Lachnospiraceae bacterium]